VLLVLRELSLVRAATERLVRPARPLAVRPPEWVLVPLLEPKGLLRVPLPPVLPPLPVPRPVPPRVPPASPNS